MGLLKWFCRRFKCMSDCAFNVEDFDTDLLDIDLSQYQLKVGDLIQIEKIAKKRPSVHTYKHKKHEIIKSTI